jgi:hypothetical protein
MATSGLGGEQKPDADDCQTAKFASQLAGLIGGSGQSARLAKPARLTVIERDGGDTHKHIIWRCRCNCGGQTFASTDNLRRGYARTCGCSKRLPHACRA